MNQHLKTLVLIFKRFRFSPYLSFVVVVVFLRHKNLWTLRHKSLESAKRKNGIKMVGAQKWAPRSPIPCLEQWSTCWSSPCLPCEPAGSRPILPGGPDVLTSKDHVLLSWALAQQCLTDRCSGAKVEGVLPDCIGGLRSLLKQAQFRRPYSQQDLCPGAAASLHGKRPFSFQIKSLSFQPSPWGLHLPEEGFFRISPRALCRIFRPWRSCSVQLQEALDESALRSPDPGGQIFSSIFRGHP